MVLLLFDSGCWIKLLVGINISANNNKQKQPQQQTKGNTSNNKQQCAAKPSTAII